MKAFDGEWSDPFRPLLLRVVEVTSGVARNQATDLLNRYDALWPSESLHSSAPASLQLWAATGDEYLAEAQRILDGGIE